MQCCEFENRLNEILDERGRPELDMLLASHAHHCSSCQHMLARYELVCEAASNLPMPKLPADFARRVVEQHVQQSLSGLARSRRGKRRFAASLLAVAALVLIAVLPMFANRRGMRLPSGNDSLALAKAGPQASASASPATAQLKPGDAVPHSSGPPSSGAFDPASEQYAQQYADLAKTTGRSLSAAVLYLPGVGGSLAGGEPAFEQPVWISPVADGLRPVTDSMSDALHVLLRVIPSSATAKQDRPS
jgi:hypothetical protein